MVIWLSIFTSKVGRRKIDSIWRSANFPASKEQTAWKESTITPLHSGFKSLESSANKSFQGKGSIFSFLFFFFVILLLPSLPWHEINKTQWLMCSWASLALHSATPLPPTRSSVQHKTLIPSTRPLKRCGLSQPKVNGVLTTCVPCSLLHCAYNIRNINLTQM